MRAITLFAPSLRRLPVLLFLLFMTTVPYAQLTPSDDAYVNSAAATTNYGTAVTLNLSSPADTSFIRFDLTPVPASYTGASIVKATLKLYVNTVTKAGNFDVDLVNGTWAEKTIVSGNAPPPSTTIAASVPLTTANKGTYVEIDITPAMVEWLNGTQPNDGIELVANSPLVATFDSKENTASSHPPELDVVFAGGGTITGVNTPAGSGLTGGAMSGTLNLSLTNSCGTNQVLQWNGSSWVCAAVGTGTITSVNAGAGLAGGGSSGSVTLGIASAACPSGSALSALPFTCSQFQPVGSYATVGSNTFGGNQNVNGSVSAYTNSGQYTMYGQTTNTTNLSAGTAGYALGGSGKTFGVSGLSNSSNGAGVYGVEGALSSIGTNSSAGAGVWGDAGSLGYFGVLGTADAAVAIRAINNGSPATILAKNNSTQTNAAVFEADGANGNDCVIDVSGNLRCTGAVTGVVHVDGDSHKVALYSVEAAENWFEDVGSGHLSAGSATITLEPTFAQTINGAIEYHVFITPKGDCEGLYVDNETPTGFQVHELRGGRSNVGFDYRIMAHRKGYESIRLADMTDAFRPFTAERGPTEPRVRQQPVAAPTRKPVH